MGKNYSSVHKLLSILVVQGTSWLEWKSDDFVIEALF